VRRKASCVRSVALRCDRQRRLHGLDLDQRLKISCQMDRSHGLLAFAVRRRTRAGSANRATTRSKKTRRCKGARHSDPYDCYVDGPADVKNPTRYEDYTRDDAYSFTFKGKECISRCSRTVAIATRRSRARARRLALPVREPLAARVVRLRRCRAAFERSQDRRADRVDRNARIGEHRDHRHARVAVLSRCARGDVPEDTYFTGEKCAGTSAE